MIEETHNAVMSGPIGIFLAIGSSAIIGWLVHDAQKDDNGSHQMVLIVVDFQVLR